MFNKGETTEFSGRCIVELAKGWIYLKTEVNMVMNYSESDW